MPLGLAIWLLFLLQQTPPQQTATPPPRSWLERPEFTGLGYAVGAIGLALTFLSWRSGRKTSKVYAHLFELAERNIDKTATEEELRVRKMEVQAASARIEELQLKIRREIPVEAKRAVLLDRLNHQVETLQNTMTTVTRIRADLLAIGAAPQLPQELLKAVQSAISPEYLLERRRRNLQIAITIIMTFAGLTAAILPYFSMARFASGAFVGIGFLLSLALAWSYARHWRRPPTHVVFAGVSVLWFGLAVFVSIIYMVAYRNVERYRSLPVFGQSSPQPDAFSQLLPLLLLAVGALVAGILCIVFSRLSRRGSKASRTSPTADSAQ
jgi:hypothetical protein